MGKTFTLHGGNSGGVYAKLVVTEQSQSIENNTTTLLWQFYMWNTQAKPNWYAYEQHNIIQVKINGIYVLNTSNFGLIGLEPEMTEATAELVTSGTTVINHNTDGSKTVDLSFYATQGWVNAYEWSGSQNSAALTTIARASQPTLSASSVTLGSPVTIYTNRASTGFTHTLEYSIGSASGTIATGVGASQSWTPSKELARQFPNVTYGTVTITCKTYNGSTLIGTKPALLNVKISSDMVPSVSATISEAASIPSGITGYIKSRSKLKITVSASGSYGSTIKSYKITANGATYTATPATTGYLTTEGTSAITVTVTDSRGQPKTYETSVTVIDYSAPKISSLKAFRCNSGGNEDVTGAYMKVVIAGAVTSLSSKNAKTCTLYYKKASATSWTSQTLTLSAYSFENVSAIVSADTSSSYNVRVVIGDSFSSAEYHSTVGTAQMFMNVLEDKSGAAIGKMAEKANTLQLGWDLELKGDPTEDNHAVSKKYVDNHDYPYMDVYANGAYDVNARYDAGLHEIGGGSNCPSAMGSKYGSLLVLPYRKRKGNTKPDYGAQLFAPCGDDSKKPNSLFFRTSLSDSWNPWQEVIHSGNIGSQSVNYASSAGSSSKATRSELLRINDSRDVNYSPSAYYGNGAGVVGDFKYASVIGADNGTYVATLNIIPWSDQSGGKVTQLAFCDDGKVQLRKGDSSGWGSWINIDAIEGSSLVSGKSGIWHYVKYNSGLAMCWGNTGICNTAFTATWNGWYVHDYLFPAQRFPFDFVEIPMVFAGQGKHGNVACEWSWYSGGEATTQYTPRYSPFRPKTTGATVNLSLNLFAIGRWK